MERTRPTTLLAPLVALSLVLTLLGLVPGAVGKPARALAPQYHDVVVDILGIRELQSPDSDHTPGDYSVKVSIGGFSREESGFVADQTELRPHWRFKKTVRAQGRIPFRIILDEHVPDYPAGCNVCYSQWPLNIVYVDGQNSSVAGEIDAMTGRLYRAGTNQSLSSPVRGDVPNPYGAAELHFDVKFADCQREAVDVTLDLQRVVQIVNPDGGVGGDAEYYPEVRVGWREWITLPRGSGSTVNGRFTATSPAWTLTERVDRDIRYLPVEIEIRDGDSGIAGDTDDLIDVNPLPGNERLFFVVDLWTGALYVPQLPDALAPRPGTGSSQGDQHDVARLDYRVTTVNRGRVPAHIVGAHLDRFVEHDNPDTWSLIGDPHGDYYPRARIGDRGWRTYDYHDFNQPEVGPWRFQDTLWALPTSPVTFQVWDDDDRTDHDLMDVNPDRAQGAVVIPGDPDVYFRELRVTVPNGGQEQATSTGDEGNNGTLEYRVDSVNPEGVCGPWTEGTH